MVTCVGRLICVLKDKELWTKRQPCTGFSREWIERWMELHAMIDGLSHINDLFFFFSTFYMTYFFFSTFYINHSLPFMNDDEGFVPLFTRVLSSILCL